MSRLMRLMLTVLVAVLAASKTDQQYAMPVEVPQQPVSPQEALPTETAGYYQNAMPQVPQFFQQHAARPVTYHPQQMAHVFGRVTPGLQTIMPPMMQPVFQVPEPASVSGFQGHAPYFQRIQQEQAQQQQALMQTMHAQKLQAFHQQQQQQQMMQMMQRQQFMQQMHPFMQQQFLQMNPVAQQQVVQRFLADQFLQQQQQQVAAFQEFQQQRQEIEQQPQEQPTYE